jgi:hypothetical protein
MSGSPAVLENTQKVEDLIKLFQDENTSSSGISGDKKSRAVLLAAAKKLAIAFEAPDDASLPDADFINLSGRIIASCVYVYDSCCGIKQIPNSLELRRRNQL